MTSKKIYGIVVSVGNVTIANIVQYTGLNEKVVTQHVNKLIEKGLIEWTSE